LVDEIFYLGIFPLDHKKKREFNSLMNRAGDWLESYYLSYKLGLQEEGKRGSQEKEEISSPSITIPKHQESEDDSELDDVTVSFQEPSPDPELQKSIYSPKTIDLSETASDCPNKMGEGGNEPSHCPLPKVVVRSEEESLKSYANNTQKANGPRKQRKMSISQEVYTDYTELKNILSDPLYNSAYELALADQLTEIYMDHEASWNADYYEILCEHIETLQAYFEYKTEIYDYPLFVRK